MSHHLYELFLYIYVVGRISRREGRLARQNPCVRDSHKNVSDDLPLKEWTPTRQAFN